MNIKTIMNKRLFYTYFLAIIGLFSLLYYIWFRFIRERLPRKIPFELTTLSFIGLCVVCIIYIGILYNYNKKQKSNVLMQYVQQQLLKLSQPFVILDNIIKKNSVINKALFYVYYFVIVHFKLYKTIHNEYFFLVLNIIPKIVILMAFIIDIFIFKHLQIFYIVLVLGVLPLFYNYSIYSITRQLNTISNILDKNFYVKILSTRKEEAAYREKHGEGCFMVALSDLKYNDDMVLEAKYFIQWQSANLVFDYNLYNYTCIETWDARCHYAKMHHISMPDIWIFDPQSDYISKALSKEFFRLMPQAFYFRAFIETHNDLTKAKLASNGIYFLVGYLICWLYIIFVSIHTLDATTILTFASLMQDKSNPFT